MPQIVPDLDVSESLSSLQHVVQTQVGAQVKNNVDILLVFKVPLELYHSVMLHLSVDFDLRHEFLLCSRLCQTGLDYNLNCKLLSSFTVGQFVALSKTSFPKELSFDVLLLNDFSVTLNFLNNGLKGVRLGDQRLGIQEF